MAGFMWPYYSCAFHRPWYNWGYVLPLILGTPYRSGYAATGWIVCCACAVRVLCSKFVHDDTHGLASRDHAVPSHRLHPLCVVQSIEQWKWWPALW